MSLYNNAIFVSRKEQMPKESHFAILRYSSVFIPGDERSRSSPGHGYPDHNEDVVKYQAYLKREDWEAEIRELELRHQSYTAFLVTLPTITTKIEVTCVPV